MKTRVLGLIGLVLVLAGCSGMRLVDSDVKAFASGQRISIPASYRFERLPSQQALPEQQARLEAIVQAELEKVGMRRDDAAARYSVGFDLRMFRDPQAPWDDSRYVAGFNRPYPVLTPHGTVFYYPSLTMHFDMPYYRREVSLLVRSLADGAIVFESRANHDGRWPDDEAVLPAMFAAALRDFPDPAPGLRRVVIEIPR